MIRVAPTALILAALLTTPATTFPLQTVIESDAPRDPDLVLAAEPVVRIGVLDGQMEYIFGNITGAIRLEDGSVVVADESIFEVRMYDGAGRHVWTSGRYGEGPGEYKGLRLLRGCPGAAITVFDWYLDRITELGLDGRVADTRTLAAAGVNPYQDLACSPGGDLVFQPWPKVILDRTVAAGEHYRWEMVLNRAADDGVLTLSSGIPGAERTNLSRRLPSQNVGTEDGVRGRAHGGVVRVVRRLRARACGLVGQASRGSRAGPVRTWKSPASTWTGTGAPCWPDTTNPRSAGASKGKAGPIFGTGCQSVFQRTMRSSRYRTAACGSPPIHGWDGTNCTC